MTRPTRRHSHRNSILATAAVVIVVGCASRSAPPLDSAAGSARLQAQIDAVQREVMTAPDKVTVSRLLAELAGRLAQDSAVPTSALCEEARRRAEYVAALHSGEVRVYPDPPTMTWMLGIRKALAAAAAERGEACPAESSAPP